jgi:hypothetical protein
MDLTNDRYVVRLHGKAWTERYARDARGWVKTSARRKRFRATAEQVLNHLLPALAGVKPGVRVEVRYRARRAAAKRATPRRAASRRAGSRRA